MSAARALAVSCMISIALLVVPACAAAPSVSHKQFTGDVKGSTLVLDITGLMLDTHLTDQNQCQSMCDRLPGCTGWTMCTSRKGCATGCKAYAAKHPAPEGVWFLEMTNLDESKAKLPILWFGPVTPSGCKGDKWPYGLCTLKAVPNPKLPQLNPGAKGDGWVSGVVLLPDQCKGLSPAACKRCLRSKNPQGCLSCARAATKHHLLDIVQGSNPTWSEGCATCASLPATSTAYTICNTCLATGVDCGQCALDSLTVKPGAYFNTVSCLVCAKNVPDSYPECKNCAAVKADSDRKGCVNCALRLKKNLRSYYIWGHFPDVHFLDEEPFWVNTGDFCSTCAKAKATDQCVKCSLANPKSDSFCQRCITEVPAAKRASCFTCATKLHKDTCP